MTVRHYVDNAPTATLATAVSGSDTTFAVASVAGFPTSFPYTATVELGTSASEIVLVTGSSGSNLIVTRNYDGLGAYSHSAGVNFNHTAVALDYSEANGLVSAKALTGKTVVPASYTTEAALQADVSPATGMLATFTAPTTTAAGLNVYDGSKWLPIGGGTDTGWSSSLVTATGLDTHEERSVGHVNYLNFTATLGAGAYIVGSSTIINGVLGTITDPSSFLSTHSVALTTVLLGGSGSGFGVASLDGGSVALAKVLTPTSGSLPAGLTVTGTFCYPANV